MDTLKSMQDNLCTWLSSKPDYIIEQCGNILTMNQFKEIKNQSNAEEKIRVLLRIIIEKGEDTCQRFCEVLKEHQAHYQQLQHFFNTPGSHGPKVFADSNSVVTTREIKNVKAKSLSVKIDRVNSGGYSPSGIPVGQVPQADYTALGGSIICADKISDITTLDNVDFSVTMHNSRASAAKPRQEESPSAQGPSVEMIKKHKVKLTDCLRADASFIMQHVAARGIITDREYQRLRETSQSEDAVIELLDKLIHKDEASCSRFLEVLKDPEVLSTFPWLRVWFGTVVSSGRETHQRHE